MEPLTPDTTDKGKRLGRRRLLLGLGAALGSAGMGAAGLRRSGPGAAPAAAAPTTAAPAAATGGARAANLQQIPATENLMREHGVLKRVLLIYDAAGRRIAAHQEVAAATVQDAATIIHDYIESFHEAIEEGYVFPRLREAGMLVPTVDTLLTQHARGRLLTQAILASATRAGLADATTAKQVATYLADFVRMYEPHEAREDTVVFPAYRSLLSDRELEDIAGIVSADQASQFGARAFAEVVGRVAKIEAELGIERLDQFTPPAVPPGSIP